MATSVPLINPHLEGSSFYWQSGPTGILLIHGFTATTAEVRPLAAVLHENGYTVSGPLLPGHGTAWQDANRCRWEDWVQCVDEKYRELKARCERVVVGGESLGGLLALYLASEHPEILGVLSYASALKTSPFFLHLISHFLPAIIPSLKKHPGEPTESDQHWQGYAVIPSKAGAQLLQLQGEVHRRLPAVRQPILIVQGRLDRSVYPEAPEVIEQQVGSSIKEVHWMENSHHCVVIDNERQAVAELTLDFLSRLLPSSHVHP